MDERDIIKRIAETIPTLSEKDKYYILGRVEEMAAAREEAAGNE